MDVVEMWINYSDNKMNVIQVTSIINFHYLKNLLCTTGHGPLLVKKDQYCLAFYAIL